ncbi:MAG: cytochrome c oxidase subunit 3 family protein [Helicobacteraceae bacterium]|nr:cytochrome c oxidase subunit 3 family protein [Helicobacteraceae bacterium]
MQLNKSLELGRKATYPPGDIGIWIVIYIELITFGALFLGYAFARRSDVELFNNSQLLLNQSAGFVNTIVLLLSSWFVVQAVQTIKNSDRQKAIKFTSRWLLAAMSFGAIFIIIKISELSDKFEQGINLSTNTFFMFYIMMSVFHFLHVLLGIFILFIIRKKVKANGYTIKDHKGLETGASYWHMVDLLWIILFPLVYIMR